MVIFYQLIACSTNGLNASTICLHLCFKILMFLQFCLKVGRILPQNKKNASYTTDILNQMPSFLSS